MTLVIFGLQFLGGFAATAMLGGLLIHFFDDSKLVKWLMEGERLTTTWFVSAFLMACVTTTMMPSAPPDDECVQTRDGYRC